MGAHKLVSSQQGIVFVCAKVSKISMFYTFQNETKSQINLCCTLLIVENMIKFLVHNCFVESFHSVIEYFVYRSFKFQIHQEMLTGTQVFSQPVILNVSHYVFHIHILCSWFDLRSVLGVFMLTYSVKSWKLLKAKFTLEGDIRFWGTVLLSNVVVQIILGFFGEIETLGTIHCTSRTTLPVTVEIKLCSLGTTILTYNFLESI